MRVRTKQMGEAFLKSQVIFDRHAVPYFLNMGDFPFFGFKDWENTGLTGQPGQLDGVLAGRTPAQWARHQNMQIARTAQAHRVRDFGF